jgi:hypothetical protein
MNQRTPPSPLDDGSPTEEVDPPLPDAAVPASDPGMVGKALVGASPDDDLAKAAKEGSISAGEGGGAAVVGSADPGPNAEVVIGKIPDPDDLTVLLWTARCSDPQHDLLGHFDSEQAACEAKQSHIASQHTP